MGESNMILRNNIRFLRRRASLTQAALAEMIDMEEHTICSWENGRTAPGKRAVLKLSKEFNVNPAVMLTEDLQTRKLQVIPWEKNSPKTNPPKDGWYLVTFAAGYDGNTKPVVRSAKYAGGKWKDDTDEKSWVIGWYPHPEPAHEEAL